jgi:predicted outer membrane repeat protein
MALLATTGGTLTADFTGDCDFAEGYIFDQASTIIGPTNRTLTLRFEDSATRGFTTVGDLNLSNLNFARSSNLPNLDYFIYSNNSSPITVSNTTFSNATVDADIYSEGHIEVSDSSFADLILDYHAIEARGTSNILNSSFTDLSTINAGAAIAAYGGLTVTGSTFESNSSDGGGGAIFTVGTITVNDSTFESNSSFVGGAIAALGETTVTGSTFKSNSTSDPDDPDEADGGAIYSEGSLSISGSSFFENSSVGSGGAISTSSFTSIDNSTFVENSAFNGAAFSTFSEGSIISNSTFWNNGGSDSGSIASDFTYFFGNILANESAGVKAIAEGYESNIDLGANLYTDESVLFMDPTSEGEGASKLVEFDELKLSELALNTTQPVNAGATKTVAIGADSVAKDYYSATSVGINPRGLNIPDGNEFDTRIASLDQRGVARQPSIARLDVGAYEAGETTETETTETETTDSETLADTGLEDTQAHYLGLVGLGLAAIFGGSIGLLRRRTKA